MNWILTLAISSISLSTTYAYFEEKYFGDILIKDSRIWHKKCEVISGVTSEEISTLRDGKFEHNNDRIKAYELCIMIVSDGMTPDLEFNEDAFVKYVPKSLKDTTRNFKECFEDAKKQCEKDEQCKKCEKGEKGKKMIWSMLICMWERDPDHFIIF